MSDLPIKPAVSSQPSTVDPTMAYRKRWWGAMLAIGWVVSMFLLLVLKYFGALWTDTVMAVIIIVPLVVAIVVGFFRGAWL